MPPIPTNFPTYLTGSLPEIQSSHSTIIPPLPPPPPGYVSDRSHLSDAAKRIILQGINRSASDRISDRGEYSYRGTSEVAYGGASAGASGGAASAGASGSRYADASGGASGGTYSDASGGASGGTYADAAGGAFGGASGGAYAGASGGASASSSSQRYSEPGEIPDSDIWYFDGRDMKPVARKIVVQKRGERDRSRSRERKLS